VVLTVEPHIRVVRFRHLVRSGGGAGRREPQRAWL